MSLTPFDDDDVEVEVDVTGFFLICLSTICCLVVSLRGLTPAIFVEATVEGTFFSASSLVELTTSFSDYVYSGTNPL